MPVKAFFVSGVKLFFVLAIAIGIVQMHQSALTVCWRPPLV
jgi:hypothetical protein